MASRSQADETSGQPSSAQPEAPLGAVLDAFRAAAAGSVSEALKVARHDPSVLAGELPAFGIDALEVELKVAVEWHEAGDIQLRFDPLPHAASRITFRVQPLPIEAVLRPRIEITELYDPEGVQGLRQYEVRIADEKNAPIRNAPLILKIVRSDKPRGQEKRVRFQADYDGVAPLVVDSLRRTVQVGDSPKETLPARDAVSWVFEVESIEPPIASDSIFVSQPRSKARGR